MKPITTVLFDLGSTLIYFDSNWDEIMDRAVDGMHRKLLETGYTLDPAFPAHYLAVAREYNRWREEELVETPAQAVFREVMAGYGYPDLSDEQVREALTARYSTSQAHWHAEEDAIPTLQALRDAGLRLGLISNAGYDEDIQTLIDKAGLRPYFEFIISSAAFGLRKPHPRIFELALEALGARPEQAVMVGDILETDILGANQMGIRSIWIKRRADLTAAQITLEHIQPAGAIETLADLPDLLASWNSSLDRSPTTT